MTKKQNIRGTVRLWEYKPHNIIHEDSRLRGGDPLQKSWFPGPPISPPIWRLLYIPSWTCFLMFSWHSKKWRKAGSVGWPTGQPTGPKNRSQPCPTQLIPTAPVKASTGPSHPHRPKVWVCSVGGRRMRRVEVPDVSTSRTSRLEKTRRTHCAFEIQDVLNYGKNVYRFMIYDLPSYKMVMFHMYVRRGYSDYGIMY
jgi:hypothetical protein